MKVKEDMKEKVIGCIVAIIGGLFIAAIVCIPIIMKCEIVLWLLNHIKIM